MGFNAKPAAAETGSGAQNPPHLVLVRGPSPAASKIFVGQGSPLTPRDQRDSAGNQRTSLEGRTGTWTGRDSSSLDGLGTSTIINHGT